MADFFDKTAKAKAICLTLVLLAAIILSAVGFPHLLMIGGGGEWQMTLIMR